MSYQPQRAQVRNAGDPAQVRRAARKEADAEERMRAAVQTVLETPAGRAFCWALLTKAGIYGSVWDPSSRIHYNAGRQDFGHELQALLVNTSEDLYMTMEREARAYAKALDRETDAAHTPRAEERSNASN